MPLCGPRLHTKVLKDIFHLMDIIHVPQDHGLKNEFTRRLRDALFVPDGEDRLLVSRFLESQDMRWEDKFESDPDWILRRTKRVIPPDNELVPVVERLFNDYGPIRCATSGWRLFDNEAWRQAEHIKKCYLEWGRL
jgi:hypothetical protein